jgi:polyketide cyclase/dehydrase/lipid transport protein
VRVTTTTRIACPPANVFDMLADLRNDTQWNSRVSRAELRSPEPIGLGSRFGIVNGGTAYDVTITSYDRPSRLVFEASGKPDLTIACTFTPTGEGYGARKRLRLPSKRSSQGVVPPACACDPPRRAQAVRLAQGALRALNSRKTGASRRSGLSNART